MRRGAATTRQVRHDTAATVGFQTGGRQPMEWLADTQTITMGI